ncbi:MAG: hypothetical protein SGI74_05005 [Oligoflexia bacterium]|nr:hypothetical protein [Oligoflexia bacterium]
MGSNANAERCDAVLSKLGKSGTPKLSFSSQSSWTKTYERYKSYITNPFNLENIRNSSNFNDEFSENLFAGMDISLNEFDNEFRLIASRALRFIHSQKPTAKSNLANKLYLNPGLHLEILDFYRGKNLKHIKTYKDFLILLERAMYVHAHSKDLPGEAAIRNSDFYSRFVGGWIGQQTMGQSSLYRHIFMAGGIASAYEKSNFIPFLYPTSKQLSELDFIRVAHLPIYFLGVTFGNIIQDVDNVLMNAPEYLAHDGFHANARINLELNFVGNNEMGEVIEHRQQWYPQLYDTILKVKTPGLRKDIIDAVFKITHENAHVVEALAIKDPLTASNKFVQTEFVEFENEEVVNKWFNNYFLKHAAIRKFIAQYSKALNARHFVSKKLQ